MTFASRDEAGRKLSQLLLDRGLKADIVVALPRGGVVVAAPVARLLKLPLDTLVVRKIGHPGNREFAVGALAEEGVAILDEEVIAAMVSSREDLDRVVCEERQRLELHLNKFHPNGQLDVRNKAVLLVDDGMATGATTEAATVSLLAKAAFSVVVAVPVASTHAIERLKRVADDVVALLVDPHFDAVGQYYKSFPEVADDTVVKILTASVCP
jgi:putative phosphoribosyl transferase